MFPQLPLGALLAGKQATGIPSGNVLGGTVNGFSALKVTSRKAVAPQSSPDGLLHSSQAVHEFVMFLQPALLSKGERVLRILDFVDKLVLSRDDTRYSRARC